MNKPQAGRGRVGQASILTDYCRREEEQGGCCSVQFLSLQPATHTHTHVYYKHVPKERIHLPVELLYKEMYVNRMFSRDDTINTTTDTHTHVYLSVVKHTDTYINAFTALAL